MHKEEKSHKKIRVIASIDREERDRGKDVISGFQSLHRVSLKPFLKR